MKQVVNISNESGMKIVHDSCLLLFIKILKEL